MNKNVTWAGCMLTACSILQTAFPADSITVHKEIAPIISTRDIAHAPVDTKALLEKGPVIIWFWGSCCGLKKPQARMLKALYHSYHDLGLTIIAVNEDDSRKSAGISGTIKQNRFPFTIVLDNNGDIIRMFQTLSVPSVYVIGQQGNIVYFQNGFLAGNEKIMEKAVNALFADTFVDK